MSTCSFTIEKYTCDVLLRLTYIGLCTVYNSEMVPNYKLYADFTGAFVTFHLKTVVAYKLAQQDWINI